MHGENGVPEFDMLQEFGGHEGLLGRRSRAYGDGLRGWDGRRSVTLAAFPRAMTEILWEKMLRQVLHNWLQGQKES